MSTHRRFRLASLVVLAATATAGTLYAQADTTRTRDDTLTVRGLLGIKVTGRADDLRGIASTASEGHVGLADLRLRPLMREGELLES
ncbi:MAG: hypothetical protein ACT4P7_00495, partial [Gemmatimonadaceae bacterium]